MLRFGLIGCGRIAKRHADLLASGEIDGAKLVAVCDNDPALAEAFGKAYSVPHHDDVAELLARSDIDIVSVLTPSGMHHVHAIQAAGAGKHVVVEKPMALRLDQADSMIRACDRARVKLFVVKQNRFNVPVIKAREALDAGRFGRLVLGTVRVRWSRNQDITTRRHGAGHGQMTAACWRTRPATTSTCSNGSWAPSNRFMRSPAPPWSISKRRTPPLPPWNSSTARSG